MTAAPAVLPKFGPPRRTNTKDAQKPLHPRRSPPHEPVSLPALKKQKLSHQPDQKSVPKNVAPPVALKEQTSQESGSDQSATHWFDNANEHVTRRVRDTTAYDNEPPFYISNQHNYMPNTFNHSESDRIFGGHSRMDSENEDLRGVIDDLTVENKKLKYILRTHRGRRNTPTSEGEDKLFEVRMHGLPSEKRRELEFLLKNFATSVHTSIPAQSHSTSNSAVSSSSLAGKNQKTDSGYASASNSGQASLTQSSKIRTLPSVSQGSREKTVKNFLHDIPDTLLPRQTPIVMSDRAKMALVVRRLEQLFTGKTAAPGEHSQPLQQQELSQIAARADARDSKLRRVEGSREAHILPPDSKVNFDTMDVLSNKQNLKTDESDVSTNGDPVWSASHSNSPDQRPTRPLDLDIHRAQVAAENIQYIRHLGLSSPRLENAVENKEASWIYLNLLISMAQLHTVNVTPDFVRRAIRKLSTKFELSKDGHRVRWIGGAEGTTFTREEEKALEAVDNDESGAHDMTEDSGAGEGGQRSRTDTNSNAVMSNTASEDKTSGLQSSSYFKPHVSTEATSNQLLSQQAVPVRTGSSFDYKPIVYRDKLREPETAYLQDEDSSYDSTSRDSSGLVHPLSKSNLNQQRGSDTGLITFYNNPFFCSDYSGDKTPVNMLPERAIKDDDIIGRKRTLQDIEGAVRYSDACYFATQFGPSPYRPSNDESIPAMDLATISEAGEFETQPIDFPVCGLGGVTPDDNFALDIKVEMVPTNRKMQQTVPNRKVASTGTIVPSRYSYQAIQHQRIDLLPSKLPPPSYIFFTSSSSSGNPGGEDDSDDGDADDTSSSMDEDNPAPPAFLQHWTADNSGDNTDSDDGSESSVDMLAVARATDPERVAEQERQYVITQPGTRAIEGSLAATVGASRSSSSVHDISSDVSAIGSDMDTDDE